MKRKTINKLQLLQKKYSDKVPEKIAELYKYFQRVIHAKSSEQNAKIKALRDKLHQFSGSSGSYGLKNLSKVSREAMHCCDTLLNSVTPELLDRLEKLLKILKHKEPEKIEFQLQHTDKKTNYDEIIYIFSLDSEETRLLKKYLSIRFDSIKIFRSLERLEMTIKRQNPALVIFNVDTGKTLEKINHAFNQASLKFKGIFLSFDGSFKTRYEALQCGSKLFEVKPVDYDRLRDKLNYLLEEDIYGSPRVLIINDEKEQLDYYQLVLSEMGCTVYCLQNPVNLLEVLVDFDPEVILLDIVLPGYSGLKIGKLIRQYENFLPIPILYLSAEQSIKTIESAKKAGGDDYFFKGDDISLLVATIEVKAFRFRATKRLINQDGLTNLYNRRYITETVAIDMQVAKKNHKPLSIIEVDIDHFKNINDTYGHQVGDKILKKFALIFKDKVRKNDRVGRIGGEEFLIILPNTPQLKAQKFIERIRKEIACSAYMITKNRNVNFTFSAGVAEYDPQNDTINLLLKKADDALYKAKKQGRNRVVLFGENKS